MIVDSHAHLFSKYYQDLDKLIRSYKGLVVINCASDGEENNEILSLCRKHANIYGTVGIHPHNIAEWTPKMAEFIKKSLQNEKIVALGEIGLDYYYGVNHKKQKEVFEKQLKIAKELDKPVVIHSRNALEDTLEILKRYPEIKKVMHSFSYDFQAAQEFIAINCLIGVNGIVTFSKNQPIADVVEKIALKNLLVETDSPYLTPVPHRGKKNDSSKIIYVIEKIAQIKKTSKAEVIKQTTQNAAVLFDLKLDKC